MPLSVNWPSSVISVPKSYLQYLAPNSYELDLDQFRLDLKDLEDSEQGMPYLDTHKRTAPVSLAGATYAQKIEIINGYTVTFEDGTYAVYPVGANSNIADVANTNQVSIRSSNSPGLIYGVGASTPPVPPIPVLTTVGSAGTPVHIPSGGRFPNRPLSGRAAGTTAPSDAGPSGGRPAQGSSGQQA